ncbi:MAG: lipopolysaccharide heptosyltransferase II [Phycisphaerales bacterium]|nr:lipopolysaccharide heptosyltransferase II [Phycisphaerales bacterium]
MTSPDGLRFRALARREFQNILLIKPSSLGDIIHALPVLHGLRIRYPDAVISWLVAAPFAPLIADHPQLNHIINFDRARFGRMTRSAAAASAFIAFIRDLRDRQFDLVIDLQGLFRSGFLAWITGAEVRIGFAAARECAPLFYTHRVAGTDQRVAHAADRNWTIARALDIGDMPMHFDLAVTDAERHRAADILTSVNIDPTAPFVALLPGARWETKRWSPDRLTAVIDQLWRDHSVPSVLVGAPDERDLCDSVASSTHIATPNLAGRTNLRDLVAILDRAAAVLTHDSGPMHIAAALNRPLVAILGPTNRHRTGPYGRAASVVQADLPCVPCYLKKLSQCPYDHKCMTSVDAADVARRIGALLK